MAQIRHIAIASDHPGKTAEFFKRAFGFREIARHGFDPSDPDIAPRPSSVVMTDGYLSIAILKLAKDQTGVGLLMELAVEKGRKTRPGIKLGICGEHGGDPDSVKFCHRIGLTYVSCSPFRVPIARLAAAQAALKD